MKTSRRLLLVLAGAAVFIGSSITGAIAQTPVDPSTTPVENNGGWVFTMAQLLAVLGIAIVLFLIVMYMRYAPRFAKDEEGLRVVRADRVRPGQALPRRDVDISQAAPVVVAPPAVPVAVGAAPAAAAAPAPAAAAPAAAAAAAPPQLRQRPSRVTGRRTCGCSRGGGRSRRSRSTGGRPRRSRATCRARRRTGGSPAPHAEVSLDQAVFEEKLAELLEKGTDRRVAEGQARRAAMIAARKKAEEG